MSSEIISHLAETPLAARTNHSFLKITVRSVLIYRGISEMGKHIIEGFQSILICTKPNEAFIVQVYFKWAHWRDHHIHSHVPLVPTYQQWVWNVLLQHACWVIMQLADVSQQENIPASAWVTRFANPNLLFFLRCILIDEFRVVIW